MCGEENGGKGGTQKKGGLVNHKPKNAFDGFELALAAKNFVVKKTREEFVEVGEAFTTAVSTRITSSTSS